MLKFFAVILALNCLQSTYAVDKGIVSQRLGVIGDYLVTSVGIGNPTQYFDLYLDTKDDKMVVLDSKTANANIDYAYDYIKNLFVPEASNTLNITTNICRRGYQTGSYVYNVDGLYARDIITLGENQFEKLVRFCDLNKPRDATTTSNDPISWLMGLPIDGFLGIRPGGENILEKIGLEAQQLSLYVNPKFTEPDNAGVITFGGKDTTNCKTFNSFPSDDYDTWRVWVTQASFNSKTTKGVFSARFDLSNQTLVVPKDVYSSITSYFGGSTSNIYCSSYKNAPDMAVTIYGKDYSFPVSSVLKPMSYNSGYCQLDLSYSAATDDDQFVLNRNILNKYCLFFDFDDAIIGLAEINTK